MKLKHTKAATFAATLITFGALLGGVNGAVIIDVTQVGFDVEIIGTGSVDLGSTTGTSSGSAGHNFNARNEGSSLFFVGVFPTPFDAYAITNLSILGAASISNPIAYGIGGDPTQGVFVNAQSGGNLFVPDGYGSNSPLDFTASISNYDFTDFGFSDGDSITVSWSNGVISESLTVNFNAIPEPSSALLLGLGILGVFGRRRRINCVEQGVDLNT